MNRQQRRTASKLHVPGELGYMGQQVQAALAAIQKIQGLEGTVKTLERFQKDIHETSTLLKAVVGDLETITQELELQREVTLRLLRLYVGRDTLISEEVLRADEAHIRTEAQSAKESA